MKYSLIIALLAVTIIIACQSTTKDSKQELIPNSDKQLRLEYEQQQSINIDSLWNLLALEKGGCLTGGQHVRDGKFGGTACVMTRSKEWKLFFATDSTQLTDFLLSKLTGDTIKTKIHSCPFSMATEGELAVYGLQNIYKLNWFDFKAFHEFQDRQAESSSENHQAWLQSILANKKKRAVLINCWKEKANN